MPTIPAAPSAPFADENAQQPRPRFAETEDTRVPKRAETAVYTPPSVPRKVKRRWTSFELSAKLKRLWKRNRKTSSDYAVDPFCEWKDGPAMRRECFTAEQLYYLTPRTIHLESRKVFIGAFPARWIERASSQIGRKITSRIDYAEQHFPHADFPHYSPRGPVLEPCDHAFLSQSRTRYWAMKGERRHKDILMALEIGKRTDQALRARRRKHEQLLAAERRRRMQLRSQRLREVWSQSSRSSELSKRRSVDHLLPEPAPDGKQWSNDHLLLEPAPDSDSRSVRLQQIYGKQAAVSSVPSIVLEPLKIHDSKVSPQGLSTAPPEPTTNLGSSNSTSSEATTFDPSQSSLFFDAPEELPPQISSDFGSTQAFRSVRATASNSSKERLNNTSKERLSDASKRRLSNASKERLSPGVIKLREASPECIELSSPSSTDVEEPGKVDLEVNVESDRRSVFKKKTQRLLVKVAPPKETEADEEGSETEATPEPEPELASDETDEDEIVAAAGTGALKALHGLNLHDITHKHRDMIYQGRFIVQERQTVDCSAPFSGDFSGTATRLLGVWKEYAIFVKRTTNIDRPLVMYFFASVNDKKLVRRSQHRWSHSLDYRLRLGPHYELGVFSGLDMSLALWKPSVKHPDKVRILVIQSPVTEDLVDLEYIINAATRGTPPLRTPVDLNVHVPALRMEVQVSSYRRRHDAYNTWAEHELVSYASLKEPTASASEFLNEVNKKLWEALLQAPSYRFSRKGTLAWLVDGHPHAPIWIPNSVSYLHPITRLERMMPRSSSLAFLQPNPRCYVSSDNKSSPAGYSGLEEPPALEGYCDKVIFARGIKWGQYLRTCDNYLLVGRQSIAVPPILASSQDELEKVVDPYPLTADGEDIKWISESTCLREIDYHDAIAFAEHERSVNGVANSKSLINLLYIDTIEVAHKGSQTVILKHANNRRCALNFSTAEAAEAWCTRLQHIAEFWRLRRQQSLLASCDPVESACITPFLQNRTLVLSGTLYLKKYRMATFKLYHVLLTPTRLIAFRPSQKGQPSAHPKTMVPVNSLVHRQHFSMKLHLTYVYDGPLAGHVLMENSYLDPNDPVSRALPIAFEDGEKVRESEIERCLVVWRSNQSRTQRFFKGKKSAYVALLARSTRERDQWATAIRYVQKQLAATNSVLNEEERQHANMVAPDESSSDDSSDDDL